MCITFHRALVGCCLPACRGDTILIWKIILTACQSLCPILRRTSTAFTIRSFLKRVFTIIMSGKKASRKSSKRRSRSRDSSVDLTALMREVHLVDRNGAAARRVRDHSGRSPSVPRRYQDGLSTSVPEERFRDGADGRRLSRGRGISTVRHGSPIPVSCL